MSANHVLGNYQEIDNEEHRYFNGAGFKAVIPYEVPNKTSRYDYGSPPIYYIGTSDPGTLSSDARWIITRYDLTDSSNATGLIAYNVSWDNRAGVTYA